MCTQALLYWFCSILGVKAYLRISGAVLMGAILVVGALLLPRDKSADAEAGIIVTKAPSREYIDTDKDGDGKPDWEEFLAARIIDTIELPASSTLKEGGSYTRPTTFTGQFSESFLEEYLNSKAGGVDINDPTLLIEKAIASIEASTQSKTYSAGDIVVVQNSEEAYREYGNQIASIMLNLPETGQNEMVTFSDAMKKNDPDELKKLSLVEESYRSLVAQSLEIPVPSTYAQLHLALINGYEALLLDTHAMSLGFEDPLFALSRVKEHYADTTQLFETIKGIQNKLLADSVVYTEGEPGSYLYIFKL